MKMNILSKTIGIFIWIAMILMKGNIIVGKKNMWTKWTPTIDSHNTVKKRPKKKIKIESSKNNPPKNVDVLGYMKDIIKQFFYYCYHYYYY